MLLQHPETGTVVILDIGVQLYVHECNNRWSILRSGLQIPGLAQSLRTGQMLAACFRHVGLIVDPRIHDLQHGNLLHMLRCKLQGSNKEAKTRLGIQEMRNEVLSCIARNRATAGSALGVRTPMSTLRSLTSTGA